jgi:uncharacterized protein (TIGR03435 family)
MRIVLLLLICVASMAQTSDQAFDAASIRPSPPFDTSRREFNFGPGGGPGTANPGRYSCYFCTVSQLTGLAYGLPEHRIFSARRLPEDRFDIIATVPAGAATREELRIMLQRLLAERFKLAVRHESRETRTFRLVVGRGGPKLTAHVEERRRRWIGRPTPGMAYPASLTGAEERPWTISPGLSQGSSANRSPMRPA